MAATKTDIAVAVYELHTQAETAVKSLQRAGFDMKKIPIIGKDYHTEEHVVGFLNAGDRANADVRPGGRSRDCSGPAGCRAVQRTGTRRHCGRHQRSGRRLDVRRASDKANLKADQKR
jgi:hypothetical protein